MNSKRFTLILTVSLLLADGARSQTSVGFIAGLDFASISGDGTSQLGTIIGINGGCLFDFKIKDPFIIESGIIFTDKGAQDVNNSTNKLDLRYLEIPVSAKYRIADNLHLFAGPYIAIMRVATVYNGITISEITSQLTFAEGGAHIGASYQLNNGLGVYAKYDYGITNIISHETIEIYGMQKNTNNVFSVSLFYMINDNKTKKTGSASSIKE